MLPKFTSREVHFLKTESDDLSVTPPDHFFCDLILSKTPAITAFEKRLCQTDIPGETFLCAVFQVSSEISDVLQKKVAHSFEETFNLFLDHDRGIWETLEENAFVLAFWDYDNEKKAIHLLATLKEKLSKALKTDILAGISVFPFHHFSKIQTFENALKAIDHAAFFGKDTLIEFDAVSLNISGDRFYQLNQPALAQHEYLKGLEIAPKDINLINSLGVCYGVAGKLEQAKKEFERANRINPKEVMVIYNIGLLHRIDNDTDKAIVYLKSAHAIDDQVFEIELMLGHLLFLTDKPGQALGHIQAAAKINPDASAAHRIKGEILLSDKDIDAASRAFNRAIKLNPSDASSLSGYAKCLELQEKNLEIALSFAKNSIAMDPDNELFKKRMTRILEKLDARVEETQIKTA